MTGTIKKSAFTLIEVIVSVAIFAVIVLAATQIFQSVVSSQISNYSETSLQDDSKYFLEVLTREATGAAKNTSGITLCSSMIPDGTTYFTDGTTLYFLNSFGRCVSYYVEADGDNINRLVLDRAGEAQYLSSDKIDIKALKFIIDDASDIRPLLSINLTVKSKVNPNLPSLDIQTSVSPAGLTLPQANNNQRLADVHSIEKALNKMHADNGYYFFDNQYMSYNGRFHVSGSQYVGCLGNVCPALSDQCIKLGAYPNELDSAGSNCDSGIVYMRNIPLNNYLPAGQNVSGWWPYHFFVDNNYNGVDDYMRVTYRLEGASGRGSDHFINGAPADCHFDSLSPSTHYIVCN